MSGDLRMQAYISGVNPCMRCVCVYVRVCVCVCVCGMCVCMCIGGWDFLYITKLFTCLSTSSTDAPCFSKVLTEFRWFPSTAQWRGLLCQTSTEFTPAPDLISNPHTCGTLLNAATDKGVNPCLLLSLQDSGPSRFRSGSVKITSWTAFERPWVHAYRRWWDNPCNYTSITIKHTYIYIYIYHYFSWELPCSQRM